MRHSNTISFTLFAALIVRAPPPSSASDWPQFRGHNGQGIAERQNLPDRWDVETGDNILWRAALPGLAHSSPIGWGDRVYVTTAIADEGTDVRFGTGNSSTDDLVSHHWQLLAFDKRSAQQVWDKTVHRGVPKVKRHVKASHASATPATDGKRIVMLLGSEGPFCFDMEGESSCGAAM